MLPNGVLCSGSVRDHLRSSVHHRLRPARGLLHDGLCSALLLRDPVRHRLCLAALRGSADGLHERKLRCDSADLLLHARGRSTLSAARQRCGPGAEL